MVLLLSPFRMATQNKVSCARREILEAGLTDSFSTKVSNNHE